MMLHFVDASSAQDARAACFGGHGGMGGLVVTSHESCNKEGERAVYKIDDVLYAKEGVALDLAVTEALWQDAFENLDINFGHTRYDHIYRRHSDFSRARRKRQNDETIKIPTNTPENVNDAKFDIVSQLLNTTFKAVDFTKINSLIPVPGVRVPELPLEVGCKNCSTRGQVILTQGAIKINMKQFDIPDIFGKRDDSKGIGSIIEGGYMELAVTGVGARLEMFAHPIKSGSYEISLFSLPVLGFVIPGIGQAGASFEPRISVDFELDGEVAINYGIDVAIPDHAGIKVELSDLTNTKITGMKGSTLHALPFTTNATDIDLSLSLAFTPTIPIGFDFSDQLTALVTVSLDLPRLDARLSTKADKQCSLLDKGNTTKIDKKPKYKRTDLSELVLVESNISVAIDVSADLKLPLLPAPLGSAGTSAQIFSTEMPLMTSCIAPTKGKLKITEMAPVATLIADVVNAKAEEQAACPKHPDGGCTCATATTVYAVPPTSEPPFTNTGYGEPPRATNPLTGMTFYYPDAPTAPPARQAEDTGTAQAHNPQPTQRHVQAHKPYASPSPQRQPPCPKSHHPRP
ncbi:hypothetical protein EJ07DRAFT_109790 [Lizonia empirigonia]|nr:hypothetical protein EJ07DRAFT_109790 [Lizonia empirigonia]